MLPSKKSKTKRGKKLFSKLKNSRKKVKRAKQLFPVHPAVVAAKKRRCIDFAIPSHKLMICKLGKVNVAFVRGHSKLPLGIIVKKKKKGKHAIVTIKMFDSSEQGKIAVHLCQLH